MPEGDSLRRVAEQLRVLEGEVVSAESPNPRAAALGIAAAVDGRRLDVVEAVGKNLMLTFEGGIVVRSHLRMRGRWRVEEAGRPVTGSPWLVLGGHRHQAVLWNGPVLELGRRGVARLGPDILADSPDLLGMIERLRRLDPRTPVAEAIVAQRAVAGIGNMWRSEALFSVGAWPWRRLGELEDSELEILLDAAARLMKAGRAGRAVYRRAGRPCRRCTTRIASARVGEGARTVYWCPGCQAGTAAATA